MKRVAGWSVMLLVISGCVTINRDSRSAPQPNAGPYAQASWHGPAPTLKNAVGPWGQPVPAVPPVPGAGPRGPGVFGKAGRMMGFGNPPPPPMPPPHMPPPNMRPPHMPPPPPPNHPHAGQMAAGNPAMAKGGSAGPPPPPVSSRRTQVRFMGPAGGVMGWYASTPPFDADGNPIMLNHQLELPARYNFIQASIYRLKLSNIPGREGEELYPTVEVVPANPKTDPYLAHNFVPVEFTSEDLDQVSSGNYLTKVIYLPDAQYENQTSVGPETLVSTRLEPGVDPVAEAHRRGHILLVVRLGGIDLEGKDSPPLNNPGPYGQPGPFRKMWDAGRKMFQLKKPPSRTEESSPVIPERDNLSAPGSAVER